MNSRKLPADALEENVIALRSVLDAPQQPHGRVRAHRIIELHRVQILHRDPSEDCSVFTQCMLYTFQCELTLPIFLNTLLFPRRSHSGQ